MNIIYKTKLKFWYNIKKGYIKFFNLKDLKNIDHSNNLFLVHCKELPFDLIEQRY